MCTHYSALKYKAAIKNSYYPVGAATLNTTSQLFTFYCMDTTEIMRCASLSHWLHQGCMPSH